MSECKKANASISKYRTRQGPPYPAAKCKTLKKRGNDGITYKSIPDKNNTYRWVKWERPKTKKNKTLKNNKITLEELKKMADKYMVTRSGSKKQIAERILTIHKKTLNATDRNKLIPLV